MAATGDAHLLDARTKLTFWCVFAVYSLTAAPSVAGGDSGELLAEACGLGTAHPPGYPLFTMVMHPVLRLPRVFFAPTPAAWANLFTAAVAAAAAAVVGACVDEARWSARGADASKLPGLVGAGLFAFSPVTWQYAGTAEVFAPNRAGKESEIPNFKGSDLGRFPLVSADFWTSDHLSERPRSVGAFPGTRARGTLTLKRR
jgi:hypothetical protein